MSVEQTFLVASLDWIGLRIKNGAMIVLVAGRAYHFASIQVTVLRANHNAYLSAVARARPARSKQTSPLVSFARRFRFTRFRRTGPELRRAVTTTTAQKQNLFLRTGQDRPRRAAPPARRRPSALSGLPWAPAVRCTSTRSLPTPQGYPWYTPCARRGGDVSNKLQNPL